jgi:hypothetical protein
MSKYGWFVLFLIVTQTVSIAVLAALLVVSGNEAQPAVNSTTQAATQVATLQTTQAPTPQATPAPTLSAPTTIDDFFLGLDEDAGRPHEQPVYTTTNIVRSTIWSGLHIIKAPVRVVAGAKLTIRNARIRLECCDKFGIWNFEEGGPNVGLTPPLLIIDAGAALDADVLTIESNFGTGLVIMGTSRYYAGVWNFNPLPDFLTPYITHGQQPSTHVRIGELIVRGLDLNFPPQNRRQFNNTDVLAPVYDIATPLTQFSPLTFLMTSQEYGDMIDIKNITARLVTSPPIAMYGSNLTLPSLAVSEIRGIPIYLFNSILTITESLTAHTPYGTGSAVIRYDGDVAGANFESARVNISWNSPPIYAKFGTGVAPLGNSFVSANYTEQYVDPLWVVS